MKKNKLARFIRNQNSIKVDCHTTSVNIEKRHREFLKRHNLNLSSMIREYLEKLLQEEESGLL